MSIATQGKILAALKKHRPAFARVVLIDGETQDVSLKGGRQRWTPAAKAIDALPWLQVHLLDDKEKLIATIAGQQQPAGEVEDVGGGGPTSGTAARELHLLRILLQAQDVALQRQAELVRPTLDAMRMVVRDVFEQVGIARKEATKHAHHVADLASELAELARKADDVGEGGIAKQLAEVASAMPAIMQAVGAAQKMLGSGAPKVPPNRPPAKPPAATPPAPSAPTG